MEPCIRSGELAGPGDGCAAALPVSHPALAVRGWMSERRSALAAKRNGYTLIELMVVMAIISVLVSIAVPLYQKSLLRTKETLLKNNLFTLRTVIDEYTFDKQKAPQTLQDLVDEGYLRAVPVDPITGSDQTWRLIMEDAVSSVDQTQPGIFDVRSGSDQKSLEGTPYSEW
jgi:general secretion pathway protein G